ncbi:hypothetical protein FFH90_005875 [Pseudomonas sp. ATCC 43928]|nr:hypothetical protein FFH90_005875 [Pseudomonas sp. ATCC 43928]
MGKVCVQAHPLNIQKRNAERPWRRSHAGEWERSFRDRRKRWVGCQAAFAGKPRSYDEAAYTRQTTGRALARLPLLILIHPPLREAEWRCSSGDWRTAPFDAVEHIACRS